MSDNQKPSLRTRSVNGKVTVICNDCGAEMVVRVNRNTQEEFLGCSKYPECNFTRPLPEDIKMERAGHQKLPGFDL